MAASQERLDGYFARILRERRLKILPAKLAADSSHRCSEAEPVVSEYKIFQACEAGGR